VAGLFSCGRACLSSSYSISLSCALLQPIPWIETARWASSQYSRPARVAAADRHAGAPDYSLMDEEYNVVSPFVLWRRRLIIGAILIAVAASAWGVEALFTNARLASGPSAWFMVATPVTRRQSNAAVEFVFSDAYATARDCNNALNHLLSVPRGIPIVASCRRLLLTDATQMRR
jgi:hypothetical protein